MGYDADGVLHRPVVAINRFSMNSQILWGDRMLKPISAGAEILVLKVA